MIAVVGFMMLKTYTSAILFFSTENDMSRSIIRDIISFEMMLYRVTGINPVVFSNYGCSYGGQGKGKPVDRIDG